MKLIINIPDDVYTRLFDNGIQDNEIATDDICEMAKALRLGTPIPDNATNGDVIKAMFPNIITDEFASTIHATTKVVSNGVKGVISYDFWKDWWNSPYQKGGE